MMPKPRYWDRASQMVGLGWMLVFLYENVKRSEGRREGIFKRDRKVSYIATRFISLRLRQPSTNQMDRG